MIAETPRLTKSNADSILRIRSCGDIMDFANTALLYEETLLDIALVLEQGWPAGPTFMHSLGSVVEALVIHDKVFFDPLSHMSESSGRDLNDLLRTSDFVNELVKEKALSPFPEWSAVSAAMVSGGKNYDRGQFVSDVFWSRASFLPSEPGREKNQLEIQLDLQNVPAVFSGEYLVNELSTGSDYGVIGLEDPALLRALVEYNFTIDDLRHIDGLNHRTKAFCDLGKTLGMNVYPPFLALPHQVGAVRASNSKAKKVYDDLSAKIASKLSATDDDVGRDAYSRVQIPPLAEIVLSRARDSKRSIAAEICKIRHDNRRIRRYLTEFENLWDDAETKGDRLKLQIDYENAWKALIEKVDRPSSRIIYFIWDVLKKPTDILGAIGDKLADFGRKAYIIDRVSGLYDFWEELAKAPVSKRNQETMSRLFPKIAEPEVWSLAGRVADNVHSIMSAARLP